MNYLRNLNPLFNNISFSLIKLIFILETVLVLPITTTVLISLIIIQVIVIEDGQL